MQQHCILQFHNVFYILRTHPLIYIFRNWKLYYIYQFVQTIVLFLYMII